jgi:hypothetical protein
MQIVLIQIALIQIKNERTISYPARSVSSFFRVIFVRGEKITRLSERIFSKSFPIDISLENRIFYASICEVCDEL